MIQRIRNIFTNTHKRSQKIYTVIKKDIQKRPVVNFYLALAALLLFIVLSNVLKTPAATVNSQKAEAKEIQVYGIGTVPKMTVQAQIEKTGVVKIVSLANGIVQNVSFKEGDTVYKGNTLISMSTNYQGGNASSLQRQLAQNQYQAALDTYGLQKELIQEQRNIATTSAENADKLREITGGSRDYTRQLVDINRAALDTVNQGLDSFEANPPTDPQAIAELQALEAQRVQLLSALAQASGQLSSADYQAADDKPPAELARLQEQVALKQLSLQEKMLDVNKESAKLQVKLAQISESLMYPASPITGTVQRIFVKAGDIVSPGMQLAIIAGNEAATAVTAIAYVPSDIATRVSRIEPSIVSIGNTKVELYPYFVSSEAVQGNLYAVYYALPENYAGEVTEKDYVQIEVPVGYAMTTTAATYVPIDAVYQTTEEAYVFVNEKDIAMSRKVTLGGVYGNFVEVVRGLQEGDQVITTRNVLEGDKVVRANGK